MVQLVIAILGFALLMAGESRAQDPAASVYFANNTDATIRIQVSRNIDLRSLDYLEVDVPPISELRTNVPAGVLQISFFASKLRPAKSFTRNLTANSGSHYRIEIFPKDFGLTVLSDPPSADVMPSGVTTNASKLAINSLDAALQSLDPTNPNSWSKGGCEYDYARYLKSKAGVAKEDGGFYPDTAFVIGYNSVTNTLHCEARRWPPVADAEASAMRGCEAFLGEEHKATCRAVWSE